MKRSYSVNCVMGCFYPMHTLPMYRPLASGQAFPVAESVAARSMNLPSSAGLAHGDVQRVANALRQLAAWDQRCGVWSSTMGSGLTDGCSECDFGR